MFVASDKNKIICVIGMSFWYSVYFCEFSSVFEGSQNIKGFTVYENVKMAI